MTRRFKVLSVKRKRSWFGRRHGPWQIVMQIEHDDPNDWMLDGLIRFSVDDPAEASQFRVGEIRTVTL